MKKWDFNAYEAIENNENTFDFGKFWRKILDHWFFILSSLTFAVIIAFLLNRYTTPIYVVETTVLIKSPRETSNSVSDLLYGNEYFTRNATNLFNESVLIKSSGLIRKTLRQLHFEISYYTGGTIRDDELYMTAPIKIRVKDPTARIPYNGLISCKILDPETYQLSVIEPSIWSRMEEILKGKWQEKQVPEFHESTYKFGEVVDLRGYQIIIEFDKSKNRSIYNNQIFFRIESYNQLTNFYKNRVEVAPYNEESSVLKIGIKGPTRDKLQAFLDKLVDNYIKDELQQKNSTASKTIDFINSQIVYMSDSLSLVEDRLVSFKQNNSEITLSTEGSDLLSASQQYEKQRAQLTLNNQYLDELRISLVNGFYDQLLIPSSIGINEPELERALRDLQDINNKVELVSGNQSNNPLIKNYVQQISMLRSTIIESITILQNTNNAQIVTLSETINGLRGSIQRLPSSEREYVNIQRNYNLNEDLYIFLMQKKAEAGIAKASNTVDFRVIDKAEVKGIVPVKPSPARNYTLAIMLGLIIPVIIIFIMAKINNKVDSKETLLSLTTMPILGMIARDKHKVAIVDKKNSKSALTESMRTLRANLRYLSQNKTNGKTFLITSSMSGEGKSFCSMNLSLIFSNFGKRVLLVDADLRKQGNYGILGLENTVGLSDYLAFLCSSDEVIRKTRFDNLFLVQSGGIPPNPAELLLSGRIEELINEARRDFDYVIIDTPPIGIISDGLELIHKAEVCLFIVRQGYTYKKQIDQINDLCKIRQIKNISLVLNDVNFKKASYGYGYYEEYPTKSFFQKIFKKKTPVQSYQI